MVEFYLQSARSIARARSSLVGPYLDGFAAALRELGYCRLVGQWCITYAVHLGLWAAAEGVPLGALEEGAVRAFLAHLVRCRCPGHRAGLHSVARARTRVFVHYLRSRGVVPVPAPPVAPPTLVTGFCEWMRGQRGSAETTLRQYRAVASALLGRLGPDPARYEAGAVRAAAPGDRWPWHRPGPIRRQGGPGGPPLPRPCRPRPPWAGCGHPARGECADG